MNRKLIGYSPGCSLGCAPGCTAGCSASYSPGCFAGCPAGCSPGCSPGCTPASCFILYWFSSIFVDFLLHFYRCSSISIVFVWIFISIDFLGVWSICIVFHRFPLIFYGCQLIFYRFSSIFVSPSMFLLFSFQINKKCFVRFLRGIRVKTCVNQIFEKLQI